MLPFTQEFIERGGGGGKQLAIIDLTYPIIGTIRELLDIGGDIRHFGKQGFVYTVFDGKISISAINAELTRFSLDEPMKALYVEDRTYARYLTTTFEILWKQSIPAEEDTRASEGSLPASIEGIGATRILLKTELLHPLSVS